MEHAIIGVTCPRRVTGLWPRRSGGACWITIHTSLTARRPAGFRKFTPGVKEAFVSLLATGYSPTRAASEVGVSRQAAYRQRSSDPDFVEAWQEALEHPSRLFSPARGI